MNTNTKTLTLNLIQGGLDSLHSLSISEFGAVDDDAFAALSPQRHYLNLSGLTSLSDEQAALFARHPGILQLDGLKSLSDAAVVSLAAKKGGLWLNGLEEVSHVGIRALSKHEGDLYLWGLHKLWKDDHKALGKGNIFLSPDKIRLMEDHCKFCDAYKPSTDGKSPCPSNEGGKHVLCESKDNPNAKKK